MAGSNGTLQRSGRLSFLGNLFRPKAEPAAVPMGRPIRPATTSRFEAAETNRLNQLHWADATDTSINGILINWLSTVRSRAAWEASNNPDVEGVINTHADDVVGEDGPTLQVSGSGKRYVRRLEELWWEWWQQPDLNGVLGGADWLHLCISMLWVAGEHLTQIVYDDQNDGPRLRLRAIHPRRLNTPVALWSDPNVIMGIRRTDTGRPLTYYIQNENVNLSTSGIPLSWATLDAADLMHDFHVVEPDQARGVPWLCSSLQQVADLRDYVNQVMDAARAAADMSVVMYTRHPEATYKEVNESTEIERRMMSTLPPGWEAMQITPQQPSTTYSDFVSDRLRALGRPIGMPLMMVQLDSRDHNYSSARFDSQIYQRSVRKLQGRLARRLLTPLALLLARELELMGLLGQRPADLSINWIWPRFPHVDPQKEAIAAETRLRLGISSLQDEAAAENRDWEIEIENRKAVRDTYEAAGLPLPEWLDPRGPKPKAEPVSNEEPPAEDEDDQDQDTEISDEL